MTSKEIIQKFNLHYDNILSASAPGLNEYEMSLFLTQAHREIVTGLYSGKVGGDPIDSTESTKSLLSRYIITDFIPIIWDTHMDIFGNSPSAILGLRDNVFMILQEYVKSFTPGSESTPLKVTPIKWDELIKLYKNPFRRPSVDRIWRLDGKFSMGMPPDLSRIITLFGPPGLPLCPQAYKYTYLMEPETILLIDLHLTSPYMELGLSINGTYIANIDRDLEKKISPSMWELIINRAVELATRDYKDNNLGTQVSMNQRAE